MNFAQVASAWLDETSRTCRPDTVRNYRITIKLLLAFLPGLEGRAITRRDISAFRDARLADVRATTVNRDVAIIKACLNWADLNDLGHPAVKLRRLDCGKQPQTDWSLTDEERARVLLEALRDPAVYVILRICDATGFRIKEALNLRWSDVSFEAGSLKVCAKENWSAKTPNAYRVVEAPQLVTWLATYRMDTLRFRAPTDYVCQQRPHLGAPWNPRSNRVYARIRKVFDRAGLGGRCKTTHRFRHTLATRALQAGASLPDTARALGHVNGTITLQVYAHPSEAGSRAITRGLERPVSE